MQHKRAIKRFQFQRDLRGTKEALERALKQEPTHENLSQVHYWQRDLSVKGFGADKYPEVFSPTRIDKITDLLLQASDYLVGSQFQKSGDQNPHRFLSHVLVGFELAIASRKLNSLGIQVDYPI